MLLDRSATRAVAAAVVLASTFGAGAVSAHPSTPTTLTYELTDCSGPVGTPTTLTGFKQPSGAAVLHLAGGGQFIFTSAVDVATGRTLFSTPGFERNGHATVSCDNVHPVTGDLARVTGLITPVARGR